MKKKLITAAIAAVVLAASVAAGYFANLFAVSREASAEFRNSLNTILSDNENLENKREELRGEIKNTKQSLADKNEISSEAQEYSDKLNELKAQADTANRTLTELDATIAKKKEYIEQSGSIKRLSRGRSVTLSDKTLKCPDDISSGRYIAEGSGNLLVYNTSDKLRISENLSTIATSSFTFDLEEGESVKATESLTLTTLK